MNWEGSKSLRLDAKGRFVVPVDLRTALLPSGGSRVLTITRHFEEECLCVFHEDDWQLKRSQFLHATIAQRSDQLMIRRFIAQAVSAELDANWRFTVPPILRNQVEIAVRENFTLIGVHGHLELWQNQHFDRAITNLPSEASEKCRQVFSYPTDDSEQARQS